MFEPVCSEAMAPFCVSDTYQAAVDLDFGYGALVPGEQSPDPVNVEQLGVTIIRGFPHAGVPDGPRPYSRPVCRAGGCIDVNASCWAGGLECLYSQDFGGARGSGFLLIEAESQADMEAAKANIWFVVNGVPVSLTDTDLTPAVRN